MKKIQFTDGIENMCAIQKLVGCAIMVDKPNTEHAVLRSLDGKIIAHLGDYIVKNKGKADVSEHTLQTKCVHWFRLKYPQYLIYSIPNGGYRTKTTARLMRAEGQVSGILDLHIPIAKHGYHSMYIEMKNGKQGRLSDNQKEMIERLRSYGNKVVVCHNIDEFMKEVDEYLTE